jgi:hypothetical protein
MLTLMAALVTVGLLPEQFREKPNLQKLALELL